MTKEYNDYRLLEMAQERLMLEEFLVKKSNLSSRDSKGRNALFWAIKYRNRHNVQILLKYNINLMVTPTTHALFHAIKVNDIEIFMHLFALEKQDINMRDKHGATLIMRAIEIESIHIVRYLINRGANLYLKDNNGKSVSDYIQACKYQDLFNLVHYRIIYEKSKVA